MGGHKKNSKRALRSKDTVVAPASSQGERTETNDQIRHNNAVQKMEFAQNLAFAQARLSM